MPNPRPLLTRIDGPDGVRFRVHFLTIPARESPPMSAEAADQIEAQIQFAVFRVLMEMKKS